MFSAAQHCVQFVIFIHTRWSPLLVCWLLFAYGAGGCHVSSRSLGISIPKMEGCFVRICLLSLLLLVI